MSALEHLKDIGRSVAGCPQKAVLIFDSAAGGGTPGAASGASAASMLASTARRLNAGVPQSTAQTGTAVKPYLEVQYNPASIRFSANAESVNMRSLQNTLQSDVINQTCVPPSVQMSVELIFNDVNVKDSFMADKFRVSANDLVTDTASIINALKGGYSVQPQSNGLLAATLCDSNRSVTFQWADTSFSGEIVDVQVRYTMFSLSGEPVHSVVTLYIEQKIEGTAEDKQWNQAKFDACFSGKQSRSIGQTVGNLLNITGF